MKTLLITASPRKEKSRSKALSGEIINQLRSKNPDMEVDTLDLFNETLPEIHQTSAESKYETMMGGSPTNPDWQKIVAMSEKFASYDCYVIGVPIWNFSVPYKLKHYIDIIVQPGIAFHYTQNGPEGLLKGKKMYIATTHGGDYRQAPMNQYNLLEPYLRTIFSFIGIVDIQFISAQPLDVAPELTVNAMEAAKEAIKAL